MLRSMHRAGLLPADYAPLGASEEIGRKLVAAAVQRGERDNKGDHRPEDQERAPAPEP